MVERPIGQSTMHTKRRCQFKIRSELAASKPELCRHVSETPRCFYQEILCAPFLFVQMGLVFAAEILLETLTICNKLPWKLKPNRKKKKNTPKHLLAIETQNIQYLTFFMASALSGHRTKAYDTRGYGMNFFTKWPVWIWKLRLLACFESVNYVTGFHFEDWQEVPVCVHEHKFG